MAGLGLGAWTSAPNIISSRSLEKKINVAVVGVNNRGQIHAREFAKLPDVEVIYICDVDEDVIGKGIKAVKEGGQTREPGGIIDFRRILDDAAVDAVSMALPIHWHAPASIMALEAGKHVYVEKPCSHNPREGNLLVEAADKYNRVVQMGNQRRSWNNVIEAMTLLKEGIIGHRYYARCWYANERGSIGYGKVRDKAPTNIDYELWQGPAPRQPFNENFVHYNWHWFWHWGGGELTNNGIHRLDLGRWALEVDYPVRVSSGGGRYHYQDEQETPDTQIVTYDFENGKSMMWEGLSCNPGGINNYATGVSIHGENGYLVINRNQYIIYNNDNEEIGNSETDSKVTSQNSDINHFGNFIDSICNGGKPRSDIADANISVHLCHLGNIAQRSKKVIQCDPHNGRIIDDKETKEIYWSREYEPGWEPSV